MSNFTQYTGGIQPVQNLFEMGASIGKNYAAGITAASENISKGIEDYYKIKGESQFADAELDADGEKYTALAKMLGSEPETAHLVEAVTPILEQIAKGRKGSHSAKMGAVSAIKAQGKALTETFGYMGLVKSAKERRLFNEASGLPAEDESVSTKSFGLSTKDTSWSPNLSYTGNVERVRGNYRKWLDLHKEELASGKFRVMSEDDFIKDWKRRLPDSIRNSNLSEQDKAWGLDILANNDILEGMSDEDMGAQGFFMQDWATINTGDSEPVGNGSGGSRINAPAAPAGTVAQQPFTPNNVLGGKWHPNAIKLQDENERLIAEAKKIQGKAGTLWFGGNDALRNRLDEITKQINDNNIIINSLGGAPSSSQINRSNANGITRLPPVRFEEPTQESPVLVPEKVQDAPAPVYVDPSAGIPAAPAAPVAPAASAAPSEYSVSQNVSAIYGIPVEMVEQFAKDNGQTPEEFYSKEKNLRALQDFADKAKQKPDDPAAAFGRFVEDALTTKSSPAGTIPAAKSATAAPAKEAPAAPAKESSKPTGAKLQRILANEQLAIKNFNKMRRSEWEKGQTGTKTITLGEVQGSRARIIEKHNVSLQELLRLNPHLKDENQFFNHKGGKSTFNEKHAGVEVKVPDRKNPPTNITVIDQLWPETLARLKKQNGGYLSTEHPEDFAGQEPEYPSAPISKEEAEGGTPPSTIDSEGNMTIATNLEAFKNQGETEVEANEGEVEDGIEVSQFTPLKLKPLTSRPTSTGGVLPSIPAGVKAVYTPEELESIKIGARHIQETTAEVQSQQRSVEPAIKYLEAIKDNVVNGDGTAVDYGSYGKWQKLHPDAALAINTAAQAGALWYGGGWGTTMKFANGIEKVDFVARKSKIARDAAAKVIEGIRKSGRIETPEEIARAVTFGMKQAGLANKQLSKELLYEGVGRVGGSITKSATWSAIINQMVGSEPYSVGDDVNNKTIREELAKVLEEVRVARQDEGGYSSVPFNSKPITAAEISRISYILDQKIAGLKSISEGNAAQLQTIKENSTPDNLLRLAQDLRTNAKAQLMAKEIAQANGFDEPQDSGYEDIEVGGQSVASKDFIIPQSNESRKKQMMEYMKGRLGYVPAGFDDMWRKDHPESTLQIKETPYGAFYTDGKGEWKQMSSTGGKQLQPHEVAANRAVQFGNLQPDGTYAPTEFIAGSGIKLGGIGTFGTPSEASKFRVEYTRKIKALRYADELRQMNEVLFRSAMPSQWGKAKAKVASLVAQMRQELIGVGSVSDFEQKLLKDLVANPTDFFRLQSTVRATYEELIEKLSRSLIEDPQSFGLEVQMPKDRQSQLKNMRGIYLAQQERHKAKMAQFEQENPE
jgi:hypothetical protein